MTASKGDFEQKLIRMLGALRLTPDRDAAVVARRRAKYLAEVKVLQASAARIEMKQQKSPFGDLFAILTGQNRLSTARLVTTILVVFSLLFGSGSVTVLAAQGSLPNDMLYPVKTLSEDVHLSLTFDPQMKVQLLTEYSGRRVAEIEALAASGVDIPDFVTVRLEEQFDDMFQVTASLGDSEMSDALIHIRIHLRDRDQDMTMSKSNMPDTVDPQLATVQSMLQHQNQVVTLGLENPVEFREQYRYQQGDLNISGGDGGEQDVLEKRIGPVDCLAPGSCGPDLTDVEPGEENETPDNQNSSACQGQPTCTPEAGQAGSGKGTGGNGAKSPKAGNNDSPQSPGGNGGSETGSGGNSPGKSPGKRRP